MTAPVAVGYDGSEAARQGLRWAAEYAAAGEYRLRVVHAWTWPIFTKKLGPAKGVEGSGLRHSAEAILAEGVELARSALAAARAPVGENAPAPSGADVEGVLEPGLPAPALREASRDARLLVVSSRGIGGVLGRLAGSVCLELAGSSPCPLMVVSPLRNPGHPGHPAASVVVGIDGTSRSSAVLVGATRLAGLLGSTLQIVHIDQARGASRGGHGRHGPLHGQALLDFTLAEARMLAPALAVSGVLRQGAAASRELLISASDAEVLVLGTHNREGGTGNTVTAVLNKAR